MGHKIATEIQNLSTMFLAQWKFDLKEDQQEQEYHN